MKPLVLRSNSNQLSNPYPQLFLMTRENKWVKISNHIISAYAFMLLIVVHDCD